MPSQVSGNRPVQFTTPDTRAPACRSPSGRTHATPASPRSRNHCTARAVPRSATLEPEQQIRQQVSAATATYITATALPVGALPCYPEDLRSTQEEIMAQRDPHQDGYAETVERMQEETSDFKMLLQRYSQQIAPGSAKYEEATRQLAQMPPDAMANAETFEYVQMKASLVVQNLRDFFAGIEGFEVVGSLQALAERRQPQADDPPITFSYSRISHAYRFKFGIRFADPAHLPDTDNHWIRTFINGGHEHVSISAHPLVAHAYTVTVSLSPMAPKSRQDAPGQAMNVRDPVSAFDIIRAQKPTLLPEHLRKGALDAHVHTSGGSSTASASTSKKRKAPGGGGQPRNAPARKKARTATSPGKRAPGSKRKKKVAAPALAPARTVKRSMPASEMGIEPPTYSGAMKSTLELITKLDTLEPPSKNALIARRLTLRLVNRAKTGKWVEIHDLLNAYMHYNVHRIVADNRINSVFAGLLYHFWANWAYVNFDLEPETIYRNAVCAMSQVELSDPAQAVRITIAPANSSELFEYYIASERIEILEKTRSIFRIGEMLEELRRSLEGSVDVAGEAEGQGASDALIAEGIGDIVVCLKTYNNILRRLWNSQ